MANQTADLLTQEELDELLKDRAKLSKYLTEVFLIAFTKAAVVATDPDVSEKYLLSFLELARKSRADLDDIARDAEVPKMVVNIALANPVQPLGRIVTPQEMLQSLESTVLRREGEIENKGEENE